MRPSGLNATDETQSSCAIGLADRAAGGGVPQPGRPVPAAGQDGAAVGAEGHAVDEVLVLHRPADRPAGRGVPEPCRVVLAAGEDGSNVVAFLQRLNKMFGILPRKIPSIPRFTKLPRSSSSCLLPVLVALPAAKLARLL